MKNMKTERVLVFALLFLTSYSLFSATVIAQSQSLSPGLEGTRWTETTLKGLQITVSVYDFLDKKTIHAAHTITTHAIYESKFDALSGTWKSGAAEPGTTFGALRGEETGSYKQNGNSILLEFSVGYRIEAKIEGGRLVGKLLFNAGRDRAWSASRNIGTEVKKSRSSGIFGPWGNYENLHSAITAYIHDKWDRACADFRAESTRARPGQFIGGIPQCDVFQKWTDDVASDRKALLDTEFSEVGALIAERLNESLGKEVFRPEDFLPPSLRNKRESAPGNIDDIASVHSLTVSRYIRETYVPVAQRALSQ